MATCMAICGEAIRQKNSNIFNNNSKPLKFYIRSYTSLHFPFFVCVFVCLFFIILQFSIVFRYSNLSKVKTERVITYTKEATRRCEEKVQH